MAFYAIIWSIWLLRNDMVFNGKVLDLRQLINTIKLRIAFWFKAKWPECEDSLMDVVRFPNVIKAPLKVKSAKEVILWKNPLLDSLKFNVDGSYKGKPGPASIDDMLKDSMTAIKIVFSKAIGVADSNITELLAEHEAMRIYLSSKWVFLID